ncbi:MAG: hypothetical protein WEG56_11205 [Chloroflexota bacterium]
MQIQYADDPGSYQPGACNIGPAEVAQRRMGGLVAVGAAAVLALALVAIGAPEWTRLAVIAPLAAGLISLEQVRRRFCVGFAMAGIRNFGPLGSPQRVDDDAARSTDRRAALVMVAYMTAIASVIGVAFALLPV